MITKTWKNGKTVSTKTLSATCGAEVSQTIRQDAQDCRMDENAESDSKGGQALTQSIH